MHRTITAIAAAILIALLAAVAPATAQAPDPPPLQEQPAQNTFDVHISPTQCTEKAIIAGTSCIELGERWRCPVGLKPAAQHRTSADLTYNESVGVWPPLRDTHCLFVGFETAYPVTPYDLNRTIIQCSQAFTNGSIVTSDCQTRAAAVAVPAPTPEPTPDPTPITCPDGGAPLALATVDADTYRIVCDVGGTELTCTVTDNLFLCGVASDPTPPTSVPIPAFTG